MITMPTYGHRIIEVDLSIVGKPTAWVACHYFGDGTFQYRHEDGRYGTLEAAQAAHPSYPVKDAM